MELEKRFSGLVKKLCASPDHLHISGVHFIGGFLLCTGMELSVSLVAGCDGFQQQFRND